MNSKHHWDTIYETKSPQEVSWTQEVPKTSLDFIHQLNISKEANIIDVGGGDSKLVDFLLHEGYKNITVLDISEKALARAKQRLGDRADHIHWIVSDILDFKPDTFYDFWHDRATFHFLTSNDQIEQYIQLAQKTVGAYMTIGTFSNNGPEKCSGLNITQYSEEKLEDQFAKDFKKIGCTAEDHITPSNKVQNFLFCSFRRK